MFLYKKDVDIVGMHFILERSAAFFFLFHNLFSLTLLLRTMGMTLSKATAFEHCIDLSVEVTEMCACTSSNRPSSVLF